MAIVKVQSTAFDNGFTGGTTTAATYGSALTSGSKLIAFFTVANDHSTVNQITVSDPTNGAWTVVARRYWSNNGTTLVIAWVDNTATTAVTVTAAWGGATEVFRAGTIGEWTGLATGAPNIFTTGNNSSSATPTDVAMTTTAAGCLVIGAIITEGATITAGGSNTLINAANTSSAWESQIQGSAGSITQTFSLSASNQCVLLSAAFAPSTGAGVAPMSRRRLSHPGKTGPADIARFYRRPRVARFAPPDVSGAYPVTVLADTPIWYGRLGDAQTVMTDVSGNARDGVYGVAVIKGAAGALVGDLDTAVTTSGGATSTGDVAYASWMNGLTTLSMEAWVKFTSTGTQMMFSRTGNTLFNYGLSCNSAERAQFNVKAGSGSLGTVGTTVINDGLWHHLVGTYDGSLIRIYVDGVLEGTPTAQTGTVDSATNGLQVGGRGANYFTGSVDEAALYATALSLAQITAHRNAGTGVTNVAAVAATATAAAVPPVLTAGAVVAGVTATATATAPAPTIQAGGTVLAAVATSSAAAVAPVLTAGAAVAAVAATATATALVPVVSAGGAVTAVAATATATAVAPTITAGATIAAPAATATALAPAPTVSNGAGGDVTVNAVAATATAQGVAPTVSAGAVVTAVKATATGAAVAPTLTAGANVTAVAATSSAQAIAPAVSNGVGSNVNVNAVAATSSAAAIPPTVSAGAVVLAARGIATAAALAPAVSAAANVQATAALATALARAPSVAAGVVLVAPAATATALALPPTIAALVHAVAAGTRLLRIPAELRVHTVEAERRSLRVVAVPRVFEVARENRVKVAVAEDREVSVV